MIYHNPVIFVPDMDHGDPAILKYNGKYYLYHTGQYEILVYESTNLVDWEKVGVALTASNDKNHWAQIDLWAPEIIHYNGTFYMYVTGAMTKADGNADDEIRHIGVAKSTSPIGPFILNAEPLTNEWSIDAHPFLDDDGQWFLFYNVRNEYTKGPNGVIGCGNVVDKMIDFETLAGNPTLVVKPEMMHEGNKEGTWFWNEGPFVLKKNGVYYQMYSAGWFGDDTYGMYVATSKVPMGPNGMNDTTWKKWEGGKPILASNAACFGPGHHVVTSGPNGVDKYVVYHGYEPDPEKKGRKVHVGKFEWQDDLIKIEEPTLEAIPAPSLPTVDCRFDDGIHSINKSLASHPANSFYFETNLSTVNPENSTLGGSLSDENGMVLKWTIDPDEKAFEVRQGDSHNKTLLKNDPDFSTYQHLSIEKTGDVVALQVNGLVVYKRTIQSSNLKVQLIEDPSVTYKGTLLTVL
ncbi:glycoside hydrolase family 43 protein [Lederbergia citrea]|uniref:glycoside hydrolase family 43 protein n=1 Tax=Lederbergia citrea TaxID=2833581 RepID=UPI001BC8D9B9|nr:glycoside hydrolase family 43 protein [Lederbergia citrea]MBS4206184.1 glycoside hydrolase family 43 protein [Lederbergia citrea]